MSKNLRAAIIAVIGSALCWLIIFAFLRFIVGPFEEPAHMREALFFWRWMAIPLIIAWFVKVRGDIEHEDEQ